MKALSLVLTVFISLQSFAVTQAECEQRDGYRWDANLGCLTTQQVQDTREESRECLELEGDELTACQKRVANERAAELNDQHEGSIRSNDGLKYGAALASVIGTGYILLKSKGELSSCGKASVWLMAAGSISALTGEIWSRVRYEKHISQASKSYRNEVDVANNGNVPDDEVSDEEKADQATNTQISAFDYLIRIEEAREKAEKMRRTLYTISATSFAAATLASLYEAVMESTGASLGICKTKNENLINKDLEMEFKTGGNIDASNTPKPNGDVSKYFFFKNTIFENYAHIQNITPNEVYEIILRKISSSFFGDAFAGQSVLPQSMQLLVGTAVSVAGPVVTRNIDNGYFRAAYSGILGTSSLLLRNQADNIIDTSRSRQKELKEIRDVFAATGGNSLSRCTEEMRKDTQNSICYCYNADGSKDMKKKNLKICNDTWGSGYNPIASNYDSRNGDGADMTRTCITKSYEADITCKCKSNKSCLTVGTTDFNYQGAAWAAPIAAQSNSIYSNGLESAGLLEGQSENQARSINKKIDSLKKSDKYKKKMSKVKGIETKLKAQALKRFRSLPAANQQNALAGISSQTQTDTKSPKEILKEAEKLSKRKTQSFSTGKKAKAFDLDFGDSNNTGIEIQDDVAQVMDKEFKIKGDINNNPDHNIFKILSNRYKSTGLKRLFDEK